MSNDQPSSLALTSGQRRWMYGLNVAVLILIGVAIVAGVDYLTARYHKRADLSKGGLYSLSQQTKNLLQQVDKEGKHFRIISTFAGTSDEGQQVRDLLDEYANYSRNVEVPEKIDADELDKSINSIYASSFTPYKTAVEEFPALSKQIKDFFANEAVAMQQGMDVDKLSDEDKKYVNAAQIQFTSSVPDELQDTQSKIDDALRPHVPDYSGAVGAIKSELDAMSTFLRLPADAAEMKKMPDVLQKYFTAAADRYKKMADDVKKYHDSLDALQPLKIDEIRDATGPRVMILGSNNVKVITSYDMFKYENAGDQSAQQPKESFQGEQAISSALLALVNPEKEKVVFVTAGPSQRGDMYSDVKDRLKKENFEVLDWSPPSDTPNGPPTGPADPPAIGKDKTGKPVVWIVIPPDPPDPQQTMMGMPPPSSKPLADALERHLEAGGSAMLLAENTGAAMFGPPEGFAFADEIKPFGIDVKSTYAVVQQTPMQDQSTRVMPQIMFNQFPDHAITRPLQSLQTVFFGMPGQYGFQDMPTVVMVANPKPAGVTADVIVETPTSADVWGESKPGAQMEYNEGEDLKSPVPMGVASVKRNGNSENRLIVFGDKLWATNLPNQQPQLEVHNGTLVAVDPFPGNPELFVNSVLWLGGYENMIAVSPRVNSALRIREIGAMPLHTLQWLIIAGLPLAALIIGGGVYFVRRR